MKRALALLVVIACAPKAQPVRNDDVKQAASMASDLAAKMVVAQAKAKAKCDEIAAAPADPAALGRVISDGLAESDVGAFGQDDELVGYVAIVGRLLASRAARPEIHWTFGYGDAEGPRAFVAPGGYVFLSRGLLAKAANEAQLASLLAQSIAVGLSGRPMNRYTSIQSSLCTAMATMSAYQEGGVADPLPAGAMGFTGSLETLETRLVPSTIQTMLKVNQLQMKEAPIDDPAIAKVALGLLVAAGYETNEYVAVLKKIDASPEWISTVTAARAELRPAKGVAPKLKRSLTPAK